MNWIDIRNVNNTTPIYDVAWLDETVIFSDLLFSEAPGVSRASIEWNDKDPALGNTYRHRYANTYYTWTNSSQYDGDDGYVGSAGYGIAVRDEYRNTLSAITISGNTYRDLGLQSWQGWKPVYNPYTDISTYLSPGQVMVNIDGEVTPSSALTNQNIVSAYVGNDAAERLYLGLNLVWEPAPEPTDPCEELTGKARCDCEGRYWWNGGCHDFIDPMFWQPLTIEIENPGTGSTTGLMWRLSGVSRANDVSQYGRSIYYTLNDGPLTLVEMTGTPTTSKTVDVTIATGLSQGDVFKFYGDDSIVGGYGFVSGSTEAPYHYFVNYAGMEAKVYGNIKSLLTDPSAWNDMVLNLDIEAIDDIPMNDRAFMNLFRGKTAFTFDENDYDYGNKHLILPGCNLSTRCFADMFNGCTRMRVAPELPATELAEMCYYHLFSGCTALRIPPELPATTLAPGCYRSMFQYCTSLTEAPVLPAPVVPASAYSYMFGYCRYLTSVTCLAEDISANNSTYSWLINTSNSGTFTKSANMTGWTSGVDGIPTRWTVQDYVEPNNS